MGEVRRKPKGSLAKQLLRDYDYACAYCELAFGSVVMYKGLEITTELNWDHFIPYSYIQNNSINNWIPSCNICNQLKQALVELDWDKLVTYLLIQWRDKYRILWIPSVSSEENPDEWAKEYLFYIRG